MLRKNGRLTSTTLFRSIALFILFLIPFVALSAPAQRSGPSRSFGKASTVDVSSDLGGLVVRQLGLPRENKQASNARVERMHRSGAVEAADSNPLFLPPTAYPAGGRGLLSVTVADVNGDGKPDLIVGEANGAGVLLGNGNGTFQSPVVYDAGGILARIVVADVNGDGKPDLLASNECAHGGCNQPQIGVLLGNGNGTFQPVVTYAAGAYDARSIAVADLNHDGNLDLVVANCSLTEQSECSAIQGNGSLLSVMLGNGDGTFQTSVLYSSGGYMASSVSVADLNGDGKSDLLVANECAQPCLFYGEGSVGVLLGKGDGTFKPVTLNDPAGNNSFDVVAADVNGDGKSDLLVANCEASGSGVCGVTDGFVSASLGHGDGSFDSAVTYWSGGSGTFSIAVADLDGDGKLDVVAVNESVDTGILLGNGDGTFQPVVDYASGDSSRSGTVADLNGDGRLDVVVTSFLSDTVSVLLNDTGPHAPTTTAVVSNLNPVPIFKTVTYIATVTSSLGQGLLGSVTFQDGATAIATVNLIANQAAFSTKYKKIGARAITAVYSGDSANATSTSATLTQYIQGGTTTVLTTSGSPSHFGQPVTFRATVSSKYGTIPNGDLVTFYDGKKVLGSVAAVSGTAEFTTSSLSAKTHTIKSVYTGDPLFKGSTARVTQVVEP